MPWPQYRSGADRVVGATQLELLRRAVDGTGQIMLDGPVRRCNVQWCAMKRMVQRGLFEREQFGGARFGRITVYTITDAGRQKYQRESRGRTHTR